MRVVSVLVAVFVAGTALSFAVWLARREETPNEPVVAAPVVDEDALPIAEHGPYPKAEFDKIEYDFGVYEVGQTGKTSFKVTNKGEAPLKLKKGPTTCQCTFSDLDKGEIAPGESAEITLEWKPEAAAEMFMKGASIYTNDPKNPRQQLQLVGRVMDRILLNPQGPQWEVPEVSDTEAVTFVGAVYSHTVETFKIVSCESKHPAMTATVQPLAPARKDELRARSGYAVHVTVQPDKSAGAFAYALHLKTDQKERLPDGKLGEKDLTYTVTVKGSRRGAMRFFDSKYDERDSSINLGAFEAKDGRVKEIQALIQRVPDGGVTLESVEADPPFLKIELEPSSQGKTGKASPYKLRITFPPDSPRMFRDAAEPATVTLKTNHPEIAEIKFKVLLNAY